MKNIKLSKTKEINLKHKRWLQHATTQFFNDNEIINVENVGKCRIKTPITGLINIYKIEERK